MFDPSNVDPDLERIRVAYHEAGHALVAWKLGIPFSEVSAPPRGEGGVARALAEIQRQRGETAMHVAAAVFLMGGQCAQLRWDPASSSFGCEQDLADASLHAERRTVHLNLFEDQAADLIRENWNRVEALAAALLNQPIINADEATRLFEQT